MKTLAFAANLLTIVGWAQSPPVVATTTTDSSGHVTLFVRNLGVSALTACAYLADIHTTLGTGEVLPATIQEHGLRDAAVNLIDKPILPNQTGTFSISGVNGQVTLMAALWADGTSFGDSVWVHKLFQTRFLAMKHIDLAISVVEDAMRSNRSLADTAALADAGVAQVRQDADDLDEIGVQIYYQNIQHMLRGERLKHSGGVAFTDTEMLAQVLRILETFRDRLAMYG